MGVAGHGSSVTRYTHRQRLGKDSVGRDRFLLLWSRAGGLSGLLKWRPQVQAEMIMERLVDRELPRRAAVLCLGICAGTTHRTAGPGCAHSSCAQLRED